MQGALNVLIEMRGCWKDSKRWLLTDAAQIFISRSSQLMNIWRDPHSDADLERCVLNCIYSTAKAIAVYEFVTITY